MEMNYSGLGGYNPYDNSNKFMEKWYKAATALDPRDPADAEKYHQMTGSPTHARVLQPLVTPQYGRFHYSNFNGLPSEWFYDFAQKNKDRFEEHVRAIGYEVDLADSPGVGKHYTPPDTAGFLESIIPPEHNPGINFREAYLKAKAMSARSAHLGLHQASQGSLSNNASDAEHASVQSFNNAVEASEPEVEIVYDSIEADEPEAETVYDSIEADEPEAETIYDSIEADEPVAETVQPFNNTVAAAENDSGHDEVHTRLASAEASQLRDIAAAAMHIEDTRPDESINQSIPEENAAADPPPKVVNTDILSVSDISSRIESEDADDFYRSPSVPGLSTVMPWETLPGPTPPGSPPANYGGLSPLVGSPENAPNPTEEAPNPAEDDGHRQPTGPVVIDLTGDSDSDSAPARVILKPVSQKAKVEKMPYVLRNHQGRLELPSFINHRRQQNKTKKPASIETENLRTLNSYTTEAWSKASCRLHIRNPIIKQRPSNTRVSNGSKKRRSNDSNHSPPAPLSARSSADSTDLPVFPGDIPVYQGGDLPSAILTSPPGYAGQYRGINLFDLYVLSRKPLTIRNTPRNPIRSTFGNATHANPMLHHPALPVIPRTSPRGNYRIKPGSSISDHHTRLFRLSRIVDTATDYGHEALQRNAEAEALRIEIHRELAAASLNGVPIGKYRYYQGHLTVEEYLAKGIGNAGAGAGPNADADTSN
ncbi:hypothetical protein DV735_g92, partial [Chaetothyriales sp. CBS 134920]